MYVTTFFVVRLRVSLVLRPFCCLCEQFCFNHLLVFPTSLVIRREPFLQLLIFRLSRSYDCLAISLFSSIIYTIVRAEPVLVIASLPLACGRYPIGLRRLEFNVFYPSALVLLLVFFVLFNILHDCFQNFYSIFVALTKQCRERGVSATLYCPH